MAIQRSCQRSQVIEEHVTCSSEVDRGEKGSATRYRFKKTVSCGGRKRSNNTRLPLLVASDGSASQEIIINPFTVGRTLSDKATYGDMPRVVDTRETDVNKSFRISRREIGHFRVTKYHIEDGARHSPGAKTR
eukprot:COSAG02_NODE_307_length_25111_cov_5.306693_24_plen_133_part_00